MWSKLKEVGQKIVTWNSVLMSGLRTGSVSTYASYHTLGFDKGKKTSVEAWGDEVRASFLVYTKNQVCQKKTGHQIGLDWSQGGLTKVESLTSSESGSTRSQLVRRGETKYLCKTAGARRNLTGSTSYYWPMLITIRTLYISGMNVEVFSEL